MYIDYSKMDKKDLYNFIIENKKFYGQLKVKDHESKLEKWLIINNIRDLIPIDLITEQSIFNYFNDIYENPLCPICSKKLEYNQYKRSYRVTCSKPCNNKLLSISRMGDNNYCHKMTDITKNNMKNKNSIKMKKLIAEGSFTPCVTNSWAKSRTRIFLNGEIRVYRSTWEAFFQLKNPTFLYEKIRIPYIYKNNLHNYIVDFVDINNKILYEIKPNSSRFSNEKNIIKEKYANEWSLINGYDYNVISDDWFFKNYDENILINNPDFEKMNKNLKQFLKYENKENN